MLPYISSETILLFDNSDKSITTPVFCVKFNLINPVDEFQIRTLSSTDPLAMSLFDKTLTM
jgi:hypothetical protein